jgi:hypothetical protein
MKIYYPPPEAHHWIIMRLMRSYAKVHPYERSAEVVRSFHWLREELGSAMFEEMVDQLVLEDGGK